MKDVGQKKRMFAEKAEGIYLYDENGEKVDRRPWRNVVRADWLRTPRNGKGHF